MIVGVECSSHDGVVMIVCSGNCARVIVQTQLYKCDYNGKCDDCVRVVVQGWLCSECAGVCM